MTEPPPLIAKLALRLSRLKARPKGRTRLEIQFLARDALDGGVISETFNRALDGSVEDAAAIAAALRPGWSCAIDRAVPGAGRSRLIARVVEPKDEDSTHAPVVFEATRPYTDPALALLDAVFKGFAEPGARPPSLPMNWRVAVAWLIALVIFATILFFGAAFLQAIWDGFWEGWA